MNRKDRKEFCGIQMIHKLLVVPNYSWRKGRKGIYHILDMCVWICQCLRWCKDRLRGQQNRQTVCMGPISDLLGKPVPTKSISRLSTKNHSYSWSVTDYFGLNILLCQGSFVLLQCFISCASSSLRHDAQILRILPIYVYGKWKVFFLIDNKITAPMQVVPLEDQILNQC